jgi:hemolysin activation/secretion protein
LPCAVGAQPYPNLASAVIRGSTLYSASELFDVYRDELGKPISREGVQAIVQRLAERYAHDGYSRPRISIDDDLVAVGVLRIDVVEPRIAAIDINGDPGPYRATLEALGGQLADDSVLQQDALRSLLQRMRALRGLSLTASTMRDVADPEVYRLVLDTDYQPVGGVLRFTNRGTDEIGPNFLLGQVQTNGLFAGSTSLGLQFGSATDHDEYHGLGVNTDVALGTGGTRLRASTFRSKSDPLETGIDREDHYLRDRSNVEVYVPIGDATRVSFALTIGLIYDDLTIDRAGTLLRDERLRLLEVGNSWFWRSGDTAQYAATLDVIQGLGGLGSQLVAIDLTDDPRRLDYTVTKASFTRAARLGERWTTRLDAFAQYTNQVLPYTERFKIGGDRLGRGFEIAEIAGDRGLGAKVELRRSLGGAPAFLGRTSVYGFYDIGAAWKNDTPGRESAATAGFGLGIQSGRAIGHLELAKPLTHPDVEGRKELSAFLDLTVLF